MNQGLFGLPQLLPAVGALTPVAAASLGQSVTAAASVNYYHNTGRYPIGVRDPVTGNLITSIGPDGSAVANQDSNGSWSFYGNNLEPGLVTIDSLLSTTLVAPLFAPFATFDSNTSVHFAALASGFAAFVVDNLGKVVSAPVTVSAGAGMVPKMAFRIDSTRIIVFYTDATTYAAVVLSLTGSSPSFSLSVGTAATTATAYFTFEDGKTSFQNLAQLSSTLFVAVTANTTSTGPTSALAVSVSGTTVTLGSPTTIAAVADVTVLGRIYVFPLTSTTALVVYPNGGSPPLSAVVISISGVSISVATPVVCPSAYGNTNHSMVLLSPTKAMGVTGGSGTGAQAVVITVSGTTVSWSAAVAFGPSNTFNQSWGSNENSTQYNLHLNAVTATLCYAWAIADNTTVGQSILCALTESGGSVTAGTPLLSSFSQAASNADGYGFGLNGAPNTNEFLAVQQAGASTYHTVRAIPHKVTAAGAVSAGDAVSLSLDLGTVTNINTLYAARMSNGDYAIGGDTLNQYIPVLRSNGDVINFRGRISIPLAATTLNTPMVVSSNRMVYIFLAPGTTAAAPGTKQLRVINVEIAQ
jgi:hypothetical protein